MEDKLLRLAHGFFVFLTVVISLFAVSHSVSTAGTAEGVGWLNAQQQPDGSFALTDDISTAYQSTAEVLRANDALGISSPGNVGARQFLSNETFQNTEYLARRLIAESDAGNSGALLVSNLLGRQNVNGGWGDFIGYDSTVLDTAFALEGLGHSGFLGVEVGNALFYLSSTQNTDGGWSDGANAASVYTTTQVLAAMANYRGSYTLDTEITAAQDYVLSQQVAGNLWDEPFQSALALIGLISTTDDLTGLVSNLSALRAVQLTDGSWDGQVYATALALRALKLSEASPEIPGLASITGTLIDGQTGLSLVGVKVDLSGPSSQQVTTGTGGTFIINDLVAGSYTLVFSLPNYNTFIATTTVNGQQNIDFGSIHMLQGANATTGTARGTVTDVSTGLGLADVTITVSSVVTPVQTDVNGNFQISNVPAGLLDIQAEKSGYSSAAGSADITAGGLLVFSPALTPVVTPTTAIQGTVTDGNIGQPLAGVTINMTGATTATATTDSAGSYRIEGLNPGTTMIKATLIGYDSAIAITSVFENNILNFSPVLYPDNTTPPGTNTAGVRGVVLDSTTSQPLAGVSVVATFGAVTQTLTTGADGIFELTGFTETTGAAQFSLTDYAGVTISLNLTPLEILDIGQVRLRPDGVAQLLPDLQIASIDMLAADTDPATLLLSGIASIEVVNSGTASAGSGATVLAFYDNDGNERYDANVDTLLGNGNLSSGLAVDGTELVPVNVNGQLPFRDASIHAWVDSAALIDEGFENNNIGSSAGLCTLVPDIGSFEAALKWEWTGSGILPEYNQVISIPTVAALEDTNGDGQIDDLDTPSVIFHSYRGTNYRRDGVLRALRGSDGSELWTVTDPAYRTNGEGSLAVADIDGDGVVEIIAPRNGGGVIAFEHDGTFKWQSALPTQVFWGGASVADLDDDGTPEIVIGNTALNADGSLRWQGSGFTGTNFPATGPLSIVADIDLDNRPEVIAGAAVYSAAGVRLWQNSVVGDGFVAVGNFDLNPEAEIVVVSSGRVFLLNHLGEIMWGPVAIPGGGRGGSPTVADMDGDGNPEIGVAGASQYAVFGADGILKWSVIIQDISSNMTGSSVFDFNGDGRAEVVYADELFLRVYQGDDGTVISETPNTSGTTYELPVIADVDNDFHADVVICANQLLQKLGLAPGPSNTGIRVFQDVNNSWVPTRNIWNQHAYHINNVNDDGSIPQFEDPSWLSHNSYRLNTFADRDPTLIPDITTAVVQVIDNGPGLPATIGARIGNGGAGDLSREITIAFYEGDPASGGSLLGFVPLSTLAAGSYQDVTLENITALTGTVDIYVIADYDNRLLECNEANNQVVLPPTSNGSIGVATDALVYGPEGPVQLQAAVTNTGAVPGEFRVELRVKDTQGTVIQSYPQQLARPLVGGVAVNLSELWQSADYQAGTYQLHGLLYSLDGVQIDEATTAFEIRHSVDNLPLASLRTTTDKTVYHTSDTAQLNNLARNLASNALIKDTRLRIIVTDPSGAEVFTHTQALGELPSGALRNTTTPYGFVGAAAGTYTVTGELSEGAGNLLATNQAQFEVIADLKKGLTGEVSAQSETVERGQTQVCTDSLSYTGSQVLTAQPVRQLLLNLDTAELITSRDSTITLAPNATDKLIRSIATGNLSEGVYSCVLQAQIADKWATLAGDSFNLIGQPIDLNATLEQGDELRLLVLLDGSNQCSDDDSESDSDSGRDSDDDDGSDEDDDSDGEHGCGGANSNTDPHGPSNAPLLSEQRSYLEDILNTQGWSYTIVTDKHAFADELRTGSYTAYALLSEQIKLATQVQEELREAVFRGEGLLIAGDHDHRHNKLDSILSVKVQGRLQAPESISIDSVENYPAGRVDFSLIEKARWIELREAEAVAAYPGLSACSGDNTDDHGDDSDSDSDSDSDDNDDDNDDDDSGDHHSCDGGAIAVAHYEYGYGHSAYAGFDLLAQAALPAADPLFTELLISALEDIKPDATALLTGSVAPITLTLTNQGIATPGQALITLPDGSQIIDAGSATEQADGSLRWAFDLAENATETLTFWLQLPDMAGPTNTEARLKVGIAASLADYDTLLLTLNLSPSLSLTEVRDELAALESQHKDYKKAHKKVAKAVQYQGQGKHHQALKEALQAADYLADLDHPDAKALRRKLSLAIRKLEMQL